MTILDELRELENIKGTNTSMVTLATSNVQSTLKMLKCEITTAKNIKSRV